MIEIRRILCPIDFSNFSRRAFDHAVAIARWYESTITLLNGTAGVPAAAYAPATMLPPAFLTPGDRDGLMASIKCFAGLDGPSSVSFEYEIAEGNAAAEILATAAAMPSDLLVMGTHGRSGFELSVQSTSLRFTGGNARRSTSMNVTTLTVALSLSVSASLLVGCSAPANQHPAPPAQPVTQATPPPSGPPVSINAEMVAVVDHAGHALWDVEREGKAPKTEDDWAVAEEHATQLAAAGGLIMLPGTGPNDNTWTQQSGWQKWSRALSDAGMAAVKASQAKDLKALVAANSQLVDACEGCHKEFKPALPSEGINHRHVH